MQSPGFEPGSRTWQARILTKLYYDCSIEKIGFSLLKRTDFFNIFLIITFYLYYGYKTTRKNGSKNP